MPSIASAPAMAATSASPQTIRWYSLRAQDNTARRLSLGALRPWPFTLLPVLKTSNTSGPPPQMGQPGGQPSSLIPATRWAYGPAWPSSMATRPSLTTGKPAGLPVSLTSGPLQRTGRLGRERGPAWSLTTPALLAQATLTRLLPSMAILPSATTTLLLFRSNTCGPLT